MPSSERPEKASPEVAGIVGRVLGNLSPEAAEKLINYRVGKGGIRTLRTGKIGREVTARDFAESFADRFCQHYGDEISEIFGTCNEQAASDWFADKCGFAWKYHQRPSSEDDEDLADVDISSYRGAEGLTPEDVRLANELLRTFIRERRKLRN